MECKICFKSNGHFPDCKLYRQDLSPVKDCYVKCGKCKVWRNVEVARYCPVCLSSFRTIQCTKCKSDMVIAKKGRILFCEKCKKEMAIKKGM